MRRIMLLVLLALALPTAALASTITFETGPSVFANIGVGCPGDGNATPFGATVVGTQNTISISGEAVQTSQFFCESFAIISGTLSVDNLGLASSVDGGSINIFGFPFTISGGNFNFVVGGDSGSFASATLAVPEPSALEGLLLGTGLLGLVEMARRKLQLGT